MKIDDDDELLLLAYVYNQKIERQLISKRRRRRGRVWVHETIARRSELGEELMMDTERFQQYFRMSHVEFNEQA